MQHKMIPNEMPASVPFTTTHIDSRDGSTFTVERELAWDSWTSSYRDGFNNVFAGKRGGRKLWEVTSREAGNQIVLHSRHRNPESAIAAAIVVARKHYGEAA